MFSGDLEEGEGGGWGIWTQRRFGVLDPGGRGGSPFFFLDFFNSNASLRKWSEESSSINTKEILRPRAKENFSPENRTENLWVGWITHWKRRWEGGRRSGGAGGEGATLLWLSGIPMNAQEFQYPKTHTAEHAI